MTPLAAEPGAYANQTLSTQQSPARESMSLNGQRQVIAAVEDEEAAAEPGPPGHLTGSRRRRPARPAAPRQLLRPRLAGSGRLHHFWAAKTSRPAHHHPSAGKTSLQGRALRTLGLGVFLSTVSLKNLALLAAAVAVIG